MVSVIEHGDFYRMIECPRCKATLGFSDVDIMLFETKDMNNHQYMARSIKCPECNLLIDIDIAKVVTEDEIQS